MKSKTLFFALALLLTSCATIGNKNFCSRLDEVVDKNDLQAGVKLMQEKLREYPEAKTEKEKTKVLHEELSKCGYTEAFNYE